MLVGQAPGKTEVVDRRPFAGRAGKTLFRWLASVGIEEEIARRRIYSAAITRCFPGPSPSGRGDRVPSPTQVSNCSSWHGKTGETNVTLCSATGRSIASAAAKIGAYFRCPQSGLTPAVGR